MTYRMTLPQITLETAAPKAKELLEGAKKQSGMISNMYAAMANAPEALETYLHGMERFRKESGFSPPEQEVVLLTISYENGCDYCMAAHSFIAGNLGKIPADEIELNREGRSSDPKRQAAVAFAKALIETRGKVSDAQFAAVRDAGWTDANIVELIALTAQFLLTNFMNNAV